MFKKCILINRAKQQQSQRLKLGKTWANVTLFPCVPVNQT